MVNMAKRLIFGKVRNIVKNWEQWTIENNEIKTAKEAKGENTYGS